MPRPNANANIDFDTVLDLSRQQGYDAQRSLAGFAFKFFPGDKQYNRESRREALKQVLGPMGLLQKIEQGPDSKDKVQGYATLTDPAPTTGKRRRSV